MSHERRKGKVEADRPKGLSIARQCDLLGISRSSFYYAAKDESPLTLEVMRLIDEQFLETPGTDRGIWPAGYAARSVV